MSRILDWCRSVIRKSYKINNLTPLRSCLLNFCHIFVDNHMPNILLAFASFVDTIDVLNTKITTLRDVVQYLCKFVNNKKFSLNLFLNLNNLVFSLNNGRISFPKDTVNEPAVKKKATYIYEPQLKNTKAVQQSKSCGTVEFGWLISRAIFKANFNRSHRGSNPSSSKYFWVKKRVEIGRGNNVT